MIDRIAGLKEETEMSQPARERIVAGAADMLARGGMGRTSIRELAKHAGTPLGSTYHYFRGGKAQLTQEAVEYAGGQVSAALERAMEAGPVQGLRGLLGWWRRILVDSGFEEGCPVLSVAVTESRTGLAEQAVASASRVFFAWSQTLAGSLARHGVEPEDADALATLIVCSVEGSVGLCRAEGSTRALDRVETALIRAVTAALPEGA